MLAVTAVLEAVTQRGVMWSLNFR